MIACTTLPPTAQAEGMVTLQQPGIQVAENRMAGQPMSAIDWLNALSPGMNRHGSQSQPAEAPIARSALPPRVEMRLLGATQVGAVGLLPGTVTGLPQSLWARSQSADLVHALDEIDVDQLPAMQAILYTLLLAEADPPLGDDGDALLLARIDKLTELGAIDPALALLERAGPRRSKALFSRWFDLSILSGNEDEPCRQIVINPAIAPGYGAQIFCRARNHDWRTAALQLDAAHALGALTPSEDHLLTRFLNDGMDDTAPVLPPPAHLTPLLFRLSEAIGEPLPTATLPRAYAVSDLRGVTGWKAALEAAERLGRTGALSENRLLGIYTQARPSASGGVWDRVEAIQELDRALQTDNPAQLRQKLPDLLPAAWQAAKEVGLEVPWARLYGARLAGYADLPGEAGEIAFKFAMLGSEYEASARDMHPVTSQQAFILGLARGKPDPSRAYDEASTVVARAFTANAAIPDAARAELSSGKLGEAILQAMSMYVAASNGEIRDAEPALAIFRAIGLEDMARQAAIEFLLLDRRG